MQKPSKKNLDRVCEEMENTLPQSTEPTHARTCDEVVEAKALGTASCEEIVCQTEDCERAKEQCVSPPVVEQRDRGCAISSADDSGAQEIRGERGEGGAQRVENY